MKAYECSHLVILHRLSTEQCHSTALDGCASMQALQAQNLMWAPAGVTFSMFFVNIAFNSILVSAYGFTGAAYAQSASRIAQFLLLAGAAPSHPSFSTIDTAVDAGSDVRSNMRLYASSMTLLLLSEPMWAQSVKGARANIARGMTPATSRFA